MESVCPLCNGLNRMRAACDRCGSPMNDDGAVSDYLGPYAPYGVTPRMENSSNQCLHLLHCSKCGNESYAIIQNDVI